MDVNFVFEIQSLIGKRNCVCTVTQMCSPWILSGGSGVDVVWNVSEHSTNARSCGECQRDVCQLVFRE